MLYWVKIMRDLIEVLSRSYWLKAFSGLCINLSAAWFGLAFVTPNFADLSNINILWVLIRDVLFGIVFLVLTAMIERRMEK